MNQVKKDYMRKQHSLMMLRKDLHHMNKLNKIKKRLKSEKNQENQKIRKMKQDLGQMCTMEEDWLNKLKTSQAV